MATEPATMSVDPYTPNKTVYSILLLFQFSYVETESMNTPNLAVLEPDTVQRMLTGLEINTDYTVTICASTSVGCGPPTVITNKTDEDGE